MGVPLCVRNPGLQIGGAGVDNVVGIRGVSMDVNLFSSARMRSLARPVSSACGEMEGLRWGSGVSLDNGICSCMCVQILLELPHEPVHSLCAEVNKTHESGFVGDPGSQSRDDGRQWLKRW